MNKGTPQCRLRYIIRLTMLRGRALIKDGTSFSGRCNILERTAFHTLFHSKTINHAVKIYVEKRGY